MGTKATRIYIHKKVYDIIPLKRTQQIQQIKTNSSKQEFHGKSIVAKKAKPVAKTNITGSCRKSPLCLSGFFQINSMCGDGRLGGVDEEAAERGRKNPLTVARSECGQSVAAPWHCKVLSE